MKRQNIILASALLLAASASAHSAPAKPRPATEFAQRDFSLFTASFPKSWKRYGKESSSAKFYQGYYWCAPFLHKMEDSKSFCGGQTRPRNWITAIVSGGWDSDGLVGNPNWPAEIIRAKECKGGRISGSSDVTSSWCGKMVGRREVDGAETYMFIDDTTKNQAGDRWNPNEPELKSVYLITRGPQTKSHGQWMFEMQFIAPADKFDAYLDDIDTVIRSVRFKRD